MSDESPVLSSSEPSTPTPGSQHGSNSSCLWCQSTVLPRLEYLEKENVFLREEINKMDDKIVNQDGTIRNLKVAVEHLGSRLNEILSGFSRLDKDGIRREAERRKLIREKLLSGAMSVMQPQVQQLQQLITPSSTTHSSGSSPEYTDSPELNSLTHVTPPKSSPPQNSLLSPTGQVPIFGLPPAAQDEGGSLDQAFGPPVIGSPLAVPGKWVRPGSSSHAQQHLPSHPSEMKSYGISPLLVTILTQQSQQSQQSLQALTHTPQAEVSPARKASPLSTTHTISGTLLQPSSTSSSSSSTGATLTPSPGMSGSGGTPKKEEGEWKVSTYAGSQPGCNDGSCRLSRFKQPYGVCVDMKGFVYIADRANFKIRKISPSRQVSTLAGSDTQGTADGPIASATFHSPVGITVDGIGNVYVADNDKIRRISAGGQVTTLVDGGSEGAQFHGLAVDTRGTVFFTDKKTHRVFKITAGPKRKISILAGTGYPGYKDGQWDRAYFNSPSGIAVCNISGDVYVADYGNHRIRRITATRQVVTIAGSGTKADHDGVGIAACFNFPSAVACHPDGVSSPNANTSLGALYVLDESHRLKKIDLYSGEVTSLIGTGSAGYRDVGSASFNYPRGMAMDANGTIWVSDTYNHRIRKIMYWSMIDGEVL